LASSPRTQHQRRWSPDRVAKYRSINAAAEAFFSSLEWEVLSRHEFKNTGQAQAVVLDWCYGFYNHDRRHSTIGMMSPINYENTAAPDREAA
jgi:putative transposase